MHACWLLILLFFYGCQSRRKRGYRPKPVQKIDDDFDLDDEPQKHRGSNPPLFRVLLYGVLEESFTPPHLSNIELNQLKFLLQGAFSEREESQATPEKIQSCFKQEEFIHANDKDYFDSTRRRVNEAPVRVLGIANDCVVYFGWLHSIITGIASKYEIVEGYKDACIGFKPFILRSTNDGKKELLFVAVKKSGRRMLVQSIASTLALSEKPASMLGGMMLMLMNPYARHEQFLSNEFPPDFTYIACTNLLFQIYIMGYSSSKTRLLELKIAIDKNRNLVPFITTNVIDVDPLVHPPVFGANLAPAYDFRWGKTFTPRLSYHGHLYQDRHFMAYHNHNRHCKFLGNFMFFNQYAYLNWTPATLPSVEHELSKATRSRFFNHLRFHRRMSYPHAIHRSQRHNIFRSWIRAFPAILLNYFVLCVIVFCIQACLHWHEKRVARRAGLSHSRSANTF